MTSTSPAAAVTPKRNGKPITPIRATAAYATFSPSNSTETDEASQMPTSNAATLTQQSIVLTAEAYTSLFGESPEVPWSKVVEYAEKHPPKTSSGLTTPLTYLGILLGILASIAALALSSSIAGWPAPVVISYAYAALLLRFSADRLRAPLQSLAICFFAAAQAILTKNIMDDIFGYCFITFLVSVAFASFVYLKFSREPLVAALAYLLHYPFAVCLLSILAGTTVPIYEYGDDGTSTVVGEGRREAKDKCLREERIDQELRSPTAIASLIANN